MNKHTTVALGGTFDRLHKGHKAFLSFALTKGHLLVIGLTSDLYTKKYKADQNILPYEERKKELEEFLSSQADNSSFIIVPIDENEIPQGYEEKLDALIVTDETLVGAETLNRIRKERNLSPLPLIPFMRITGSDQKIIASKRIRSGEIDRNGERFLTNEMERVTFFLPDSLRSTLKKPIGEIVTASELLSFKEKKEYIITVGDITTKTFVQNGIIPSLAIIDFVVERMRTFHAVQELGFSGQEHIYHMENKKSTISPGVFTLLSHLLSPSVLGSQTSVLVISGEEDLLVLPVILLAPLHTIVVYGQPNVGMVQVIVTEEKKQMMSTFIEAFQRHIADENLINGSE